MKSLIKILPVFFSLLVVNTGYAQADTSKKFVPKENSIADKKLKKEIQQKQLLGKPVQLNTDQNNAATDKKLTKKKRPKKVCIKKKNITSK